MNAEIVSIVGVLSGATVATITLVIGYWSEEAHEKKTA